MSLLTNRWFWGWCRSQAFVSLSSAVKKKCEYKNNMLNASQYTLYVFYVVTNYVSAYLMSLTYKNCLTFSFTHGCLGSLQKSPRSVSKLLKRMKILKTQKYNIRCCWCLIMTCLERNCDSYMTAFTHGRLSRWNLKPMMGSLNSVVETLVQHESTFCSSAKIEEPNKPQYSASFHQI